MPKTLSIKQIPESTIIIDESVQFAAFTLDGKTYNVTTQIQTMQKREEVMRKALEEIACDYTDDAPQYIAKDALAALKDIKE